MIESTHWTALINDKHICATIIYSQIVTTEHFVGVKLDLKYANVTFKKIIYHVLCCFKFTEQ